MEIDVGIQEGFVIPVEQFGTRLRNISIPQLFAQHSAILGLHQAIMEEGVGGLVDEIRGPKDAHKLTGELLAQGQQCLNEGKSTRQVAAVVGVSKGTIYHAMKRGHLCRSLQYKQQYKQPV